MEEKAEYLGANAIIGLKISYDNLGGTMGNTILVTALWYCYKIRIT